MSVALQVLLVLLWFLAAPFLSGSLVASRLKAEGSLALTFACGAAMMMALFQLVAVPVVYLANTAPSTPFRAAWIPWATLTFLACALALRDPLARRFARRCLKPATLKQTGFLRAAVLLLVLLQALVPSAMTHSDADDASFVAAAAFAYDTDTIYMYENNTGEYRPDYREENYMAGLGRRKVAPFPLFNAAVAKVTGVSPAIVAHTLFPLFLIPLAYCVYLLIGRLLFPDDPGAVDLFLLFLCAANIWGGYSLHTVSSFLLIRIWQGKSVLAAILLPLILCAAALAAKGPKTPGAAWLLLLICMFAAALSSSGAVALAPIAAGLVFLFFFLKRKDWRNLLGGLACCAPALAYGALFLVAR